MKAGRELDALIAEKIMGWTWRANEFGKGEWYDAAGTQTGWGDSEDMGPTGLRDFLPSSDMGAAWEVVERMTAGPWYFECSHMGGESVVSSTAQFTRTPLMTSTETHEAIAATMMEAICPAALAAVGAEVPQ